MTVKYTTIPPKVLLQAIIDTSTSFVLNNIEGWDEQDLTSADFGTQAFGAIMSVDRKRLELFSWDPSTIASSSISFVDRGLAYNGANTVVSANKQDWAAGSIVMLGADVPQLLLLMMDLNSDQTVGGKKTFSSSDTYRPRIDSDVDTAVAEAFVTLGQMSRQAIAGASNASTTVKGIVEEATQAEVDAGTAAGGTGARNFINPSTLRAKRYHSFAADAGATDAYAITVTPSISAYTDGDIFVFEAATVNTGNATLNVNSVGAKNILKYGNVTLADGDIKAGSIVMVAYDADSDTFMLQSSIGTPQISQSGREIYAADSVGSDAYAITLVPALAAYATGLVVNFKAGTANTGAATININGLGAKAIVKNYNEALVTGDILSGQIVQVAYDVTGDNFQMLSPVASVNFTFGTASKAAGDASTTQNIAHGLGRIPKKVKITAQTGVGGAAAGDVNSFTARTVYDGTTQVSVSTYGTAGTPPVTTDSSFKLNAGVSNGSQAGVVTFDGTNIIITWTQSGTSSGTYTLLWEAE